MATEDEEYEDDDADHDDNEDDDDDDDGDDGGMEDWRRGMVRAMRTEEKRMMEMNDE